MRAKRRQLSVEVGGAPAASDYVATMAVNYGSGVCLVDFQRQPQEARQRINQQVARETNDKIRDLIVPGAITPFTRLVLADAVDFKAEWRSQFSMEATSPGRFRALDGSERRVAMMRQIDRFNFSRDDGFQAGELPYQGDRMSMVIVLPDEGTFSDF